MATAINSDTSERTYLTPTIRSSYTMMIDGQKVRTGREIEVINPATGEVFATAARADKAVLDAAVAAAQRASPAWSAIPLPERAALMHKLADSLQDHADEFARLIVMEQGKPLAEARTEAPTGVGLLRYMADHVDYAPVVLKSDGDRKIVEHRRPLGVVAAITPWNVPLKLLLVKLVPALFAGNTVVAKPAATTPLSTCLLAEIWNEILPPGVFNVICDDNDLGDALSSHPGIAKIGFTGSTATGMKVMASAAGTLKRLTLELGGNDPALVLDDVDPIEMARRVFTAAMANAGQICLATKRIFVHARMYDVFCKELAGLADATIVGDGLDPATTMGPIQNAAQYHRALGYLDDARTSGTIIAGGVPVPGPGYFIRPTIVRDIPDSARLVREEQFCPVLPVLSYENLDNAIERANATEYGLGATVWGRDLERAFDVAMRIEAGTVWINEHMVIDPGVTARGAKLSGFGGELGPEGFDAYTQGYVVYQRSPS
jgi:acyl-CoA reductase-like NAD-dependent aldehyde dehydrogenase